MRKDCSTCKYEKISEENKPCSDCYNSFCGMLFNKPSQYEQRKTQSCLDATVKQGEGEK